MMFDTSRSTRRRTVHGTTIGIIVLDTGFRRLPGDIGNTDTWPFPVQFAVARNVRPQDVIGANADATLGVFYRVIDDLVSLGVDGISTSCGYLAIVHDALRRHSPVPLATSSLQQIPAALTMLPHGKTVGVLVSDSAALQDQHFTAVGAPTGLPVAELPANGLIRTRMASNSLDGDYEAQKAEVLQVVRQMLLDNPSIGAIVSECANLPPYSAAIQNTFRIPVYDIVTLVSWMRDGLRPRHFVQDR